MLERRIIMPRANFRQFDINNYLIIVINEIYLMLDNLDVTKKAKYQAKFGRIMEDYEQTNEIFAVLERDLHTNAPYQNMMGLKLSYIEKNLEHFKNELQKEKINIKTNTLSNIISQINYFIYNYPNFNDLIQEYKLLNNETANMFQNMNEKDKSFLIKQISLLFINLVKYNKFNNNLAALINATNPIFYDSLIVAGEHYLFDVMQADKTLKNTNMSQKDYLLLIYTLAFKDYDLAYRSAYLR